MANMVTSRLRIILQGLTVNSPGKQSGMLINVPLFHATGLLTSFLQGLDMGRKHVILPGKWDADVAAAIIEEERLTGFTGVPTQSMELVNCDEFKRRDMSSLKSIGGGGSVAPAKMVSQIHSLGKSPGNGYGLTETSAGIANIGGADWVARPLSCGKITPLMDARIVNPEDSLQEVSVGSPGELCVKGAFVFKEYWNKPEATAKAFYPDDLGRPRWFRTGDLATIDADGFITILDRLKDMVIRGGENVSCAEVESAIAFHPAVTEVAVMGLPDER
jgi:acyl-CoA synthetase (AMP-forming)/AMP-acid ligase II